METIPNGEISECRAFGRGLEPDGHYPLQAAEDGEHRPDDDADRLRHYLNEVASFPLLSADEEARLAKAVEAGDEAARCRLIESNLRLVVAIAKRHNRRGLRLADMIQAGNIGLGRAVDQYDWRKGLKFSTYARWWIRRAITELLKDPGAPGAP